jgi:hypothetical protein
MKLSSDGAEIEGANKIEVYGDWIMFEDDHGATILIDPNVVRQLAIFMLAQINAFDKGVWE